MKGLLVIRKGSIGDILDRINNLSSGTTEVNIDATHERITASFCKRTPGPRLEPPPPIAHNLFSGRKIPPHPPLAKEGWGDL
jgi:hypothetical protein